MRKIQKITSLFVCVVFSAPLNAMLVNVFKSRSASNQCVQKRTWIGGSGKTDARWEKEQADRRLNEARTRYYE